MVMALKLSAATSSSAFWRSRREMGASVAMKASMVAMSGQIMPAPLAIPVMVISRPSLSCSRSLQPLATVSVVMMARAASSHASLRNCPAARGMALHMRSTGNGSPITPVEKGSTMPPSWVSAAVAH